MKKEKNKKKEIKKPNINFEPPKSIFQNIFFYVFLVFAVLIFLDFFAPSIFSNLGLENRPLSHFIDNAKNKKITEVTVSGNDIIYKIDNTTFLTKKEAGASLDSILDNNGINFSNIQGEITIKQDVAFDQIISTLLMFGLPILILFFILRQMKGASGEIASFGKSRAKMFNKGPQNVTFDDVAANSEAKVELKEIVDFLKSPEKYRDVGARIPKGVLLVGPAGVGKTLLAKAIAGEAEVPFYSVAGSEFMEMLVGVGSARARDLFKMAKESQPALIFIDEIDAIGRQRGMGIGGGHDEREQTLNQILIEMDGFDPRTNVIVIAATNRPDMLDPALVRPGRFDRRVTLYLPDFEGRKEILKIHSKNKPLSPEVSIDKLAKSTVGFSGADIENMLNEAAIIAARENRKVITSKDLDEASLKVTIGPERKTLQTEEEKKFTAYHEAGHAIVASFAKDMDAVERITIVPRGSSLGHTSLPPERDRYNETQTRLMSHISVMLGGRAAEEIFYKEFSVGASSDIERATSIARKMVTEYGMSALGPIAFDGEGKHIWLAKEMNEGPLYSEEVAAKIDAEIKKIIDSCYKNALEILNKNRDKVEKVVIALLEKETLTSEEYLAIISE